MNEALRRRTVLGALLAAPAAGWSQRSYPGMPPATQPLGPVPAIGSELRGFEFASWIGLMAPRGLPAGAIDALAKATASALQRSDLQKAFESNGAVPHASSADDFRAFLARDIETNKRAVAAAGIQPE
jgi:hypothetical protein